MLLKSGKDGGQLMALRGPGRTVADAAITKAASESTVNSQLACRFQVKWTWAKDLWHLCSRILWKVLSHTVAAWINVSQGHRPLDFASLVTD
jgi:hypothetical protein